VVLAEIAGSVVVGAQVAAEPDSLEVFGAGVFDSVAGTGALEIAPEVEFQETPGMVGTPAFREVFPVFEA
jgi:hypothetical protein